MIRIGDQNFTMDELAEKSLVSENVNFNQIHDYMDSESMNRMADALEDAIGYGSGRVDTVSDAESAAAKTVDYAEVDEPIDPLV